MSLHERLFTGYLIMKGYRGNRSKHCKRNSKPSITCSRVWF